MGRGSTEVITCEFCGRRVPVDKASRVTRSSFSYFDERAGIQHRGFMRTVHCCPSCARHRTIDDERPRYGKPKRR